MNLLSNTPTRGGWRAGFLLSVFAGLGGALSSAAMGADLAATGPAVPGFEAYDRQIPALLEKWSIPGATVAVAVDGRIVFARGYGLADRESGGWMQPDTRMRIGSVSKIIAATKVLKLCEEGRIALNEPVFPRLGWPTPGYAGAARDPRLDQITVAQLLSHTAGWNGGEAEIPFSGGLRGFDPLYMQREIAEFFGLPPPASAETITQAMVGQPLQTAPGTAYSYSNIGYLVLGRLIEQVTGLSYEDAVKPMLADAGVSGHRIGGARRAELLDDEAVYYDYPGAPLRSSHLGDAGLLAEPYVYSLRSWDSSGGWTISAIEGVRFLLALDGVGVTPRLLQPGSLAAMRSEQFRGSSYGYGWCTNNAPMSDDTGHNGGCAGTCAAAVRSKDGRRHTVVLCNSRPADVSTFLNELYQTLHGVEQPAAAPAADLTLTTLGWEPWQRRFLGEAAPAPLEDSDHDGLPHLLEYAAGLDPMWVDAQAPAELRVRADDTMELTFRRLILAHPLRWSVEGSTDGTTWNEVATEAQAALNADGTMSVSVPVNGVSRARLRVRQQASGVESVFEPALTPQFVTVPAGEKATFSAGTTPGSRSCQWRRNGIACPTLSGTAVTLAATQPADAGVYTAAVEGSPDLAQMAAIVGVRSTAKVIGDGEVVGSDIRHANGNIYDQVLLTGAAATITADPGQVTRISYIDLTDDIVQVEFSGAGSLTIVLANASGPALPVNYHQGVRYMKGHATLVVADADATTNVAVFAVGKGNAVNAALFKPEVDYDGIADLATLAIQSATGECGGVFMGNAQLFASAGVTGVLAPGARPIGPVRLGDVNAFDQAEPMLVFGALPDLAVTGGDLAQENQRAVQLRGVAGLHLTAGAKSDGRSLPAQGNRARFTRYGIDVTPWVVAR